MDIVIRDIRTEDHEAVHNIFCSQHVILGTMRLPYQALDQIGARLEPAEGMFRLGAHAGGALVGFCELATYPNVPRHRHAGEINMIVTHENWIGKGVGRKLMDAVIDLADNWLNLTRLGLVVWTDNEAAIRLYEPLGFNVEGTMRDYVFSAGRYTDACMMARIRPAGCGQA